MRSIVKWLSRCYWKIVDSGCRYLTLSEWNTILRENLIESLTGEGIVRYVMFVIKP